MPVRLATTADLDAIAEMAATFMDCTRYAAKLAPTVNDFRSSFAVILDQGRIWVAEVDGVVCGFLAGMVGPFWFLPTERYALEVAWWMDPAYRGRPEGVRLLFEFERWAKEHQVAAICMSDIVIKGESAAERILQRLGYSMTERTFVKGLG